MKVFRLYVSMLVMFAVPSFPFIVFFSLFFIFYLLLSLLVFSQYCYYHPHHNHHHFLLHMLLLLLHHFFLLCSVVSKLSFCFILIRYRHVFPASIGGHKDTEVCYSAEEANVSPSKSFSHACSSFLSSCDLGFFL